MNNLSVTRPYTKRRQYTPEFKAQLVLTYEDLTDYREPFILQTRTQDDGKCRQVWHCNSLLNRLRLKRDQKRIPGLAVRFGPASPKITTETMTTTH